MEPSACRNHLATLVAQETSTLEQLTGLLAHEYDLLVANDVDALESAMVERQHCVGKLVNIEDERRSLCRMLGYTTDLPGLQSLMVWCDPDGSLKDRWAECAARGASCREQNDRNGALVNARLKRVESMLGAITGKPPEGRTYGPKGAYATPTAGRVLTVEA